MEMQQKKRDHRGRRRTTAASLRHQILRYLVSALPDGWISQPLVPGDALADAVPESHERAGDILLISPRGRCHFLFVRAPADRWWDGGLHQVPAEPFSERDGRLARQLRAAGHKARAIWCQQYLERALRAWGCPLKRPVSFRCAGETSTLPGQAGGRWPKLTLRFDRTTGRQANV